MTRAAIYTRISRDDDGDAAGVKRQEKDCRALAKTKGWEVVRVFCDNDKSAYNGKTRPQFDEMVAALKNGEYDALIAWKYDRLSRTGVRGLVPLLDALGDDRPLACVLDSIDTSTPMGEGLAALIASMAKQEAKNTGDRVRRKKDELAEQGKPPGGGRWFGFQADNIHHDRKEAALVREMMRKLDAGASPQSIADDWNRRNIPQVQGGTNWNQATVRRIAQAPRVAGLRVHRGEIVGPSVSKPFVSRDLWERVQLRLKVKASQPRRRGWLTGKIICGECGHPMVHDTAYEGRRVWRCRPRFKVPGCGQVRCPAEPLEDIVRDALLTALDGPGLGRMLAAKDTGAGEELAAAEATLHDLAELHGAGTISTAEWMTSRRAAEKRADDARQRLANDNATRALEEYREPGTLRRAWPKLDADRKRTILNVAIERIDVAKGAGNGARFDPDRIVPVWKV